MVAAAKFLVAATKKLFVVPNFVAVTKLFFRSIFHSVSNNQRKKKEGKSWYGIPVMCFPSQEKALPSFNPAVIVKTASHEAAQLRRRQCRLFCLSTGESGAKASPEK